MLGPHLVQAGDHPESWYRDRWCADHQGRAEVVLSDGSRCDCLTDTQAVEVDFAPKWAESVGQALLYGRLTGRQPTIVLIMRRASDLRCLDRLRSIIAAYGLPIQVVIATY